MKIYENNVLVLEVSDYGILKDKKLYNIDEMENINLSTATTKSTYKDSSLSIDVCSQCHPFYTGKQKILDTAGQVDKFKKRYSKT